MGTQMDEGVKFGTITLQESNPWWEGSLSQAKVIAKVVLYNRTDKFAELIIGSRLTILMDRQEMFQYDDESSKPS